MKKAITGTIALLIITLVLTQSCSADFVASVIPGWHTTVFPRLIITQITGFWLLAVIVIYFLFLKRETSSTTVYTYLLMTIPFLLCDILPFLFNVFGFTIINIYITFFCITILPFLIAQVVFIVKLFSYTINRRVQ